MFTHFVFLSSRPEYSPDHLSGFEEDLVTCAIVVFDEQRPILLQLLPDVQDRRDHVAPGLVQVSDQR